MRTQKGNLNVIIVVLVGLLLVLGFGIYYISKQPPTLKQNAVMNSLRGISPEISLTDWSKIDIQIDDMPVEEQRLLSARIISPALEYYKQSAESRRLVFMKIGINDDETKDQFPYVGHLGFDTQEVEDFWIEKKDGEIQWWQPTCVSCTFTGAYRQKFPEVVKAKEIPSDLQN